MYTTGIVIIAFGLCVILYKLGYDTGAQDHKFTFKNSLNSIHKEEDRYFKVREIPQDRIEYKTNAWGGAYFEKPNE